MVCLVPRARFASLYQQFVEPRGFFPMLPIY
jgi:hypothetical protein